MLPGMAEPAPQASRPRAARPRRESADARREALISAAMTCIADLGLEGASVRAICEAAGVSTGLMNHYYAGKEALIADVYRRLADDLGEAVDARTDTGAATARRRLESYVAASFSPVNLDPQLLRVWLAFWSMTRRSGEIAEVHRATYAAYRARLEAMLAALAEEEGLERLDVRLAAIGLSALLDGLWLEWCLDPSTFAPEEGRRLCLAWLDGLTATGGPVLPEGAPPGA